MRTIALLALAACAPSTPDKSGPTGASATTEGSLDTPAETPPDPVAEDCTNGRDDDGDGAQDCDDVDCAATCDSDADGFVAAALGGDDCDDSDAAVHPGADEVCNGWDDDCDGRVDAADDDLVGGAVLWAPDEDGDGYGDDDAEVAVHSEPVCPGRPGLASNTDDCDDGDPAVNPDGVEVCNGRDDDCDGRVDTDDPDRDLTDAPTWFPDLDGDGFGVPEGAVADCRPPDAAWSDRDDDCDDTDPELGAPSDWLVDGDGDGVGAGDGLGGLTCDRPDGRVADWWGEDCADDDPGRFPGNAEICEDGVDQDCDGEDAPCLGELYFAGHNGGLASYDTRTGVVTDLELDLPLTGLAFDDAGTLWGIGSTMGDHGMLYRIDVEAGTWEEVLALGLSEASLTWSDGVLVAADNGDEVLMVDPVFGVVSEVPMSGRRPYDYGMDLAADPAGGLLYVGGTELFTLDPSTGALSAHVRVIGSRREQGGAATFHGGELHYVSYARTTAYLAVIDPLTGDASVTHVPLPFPGVDAVASPTP